MHLHVNSLQVCANTFCYYQNQYYNKDIQCYNVKIHLRLTGMRKKQWTTVLQVQQG